MFLQEGDLGVVTVSDLSKLARSSKKADKSHYIFSLLVSRSEVRCSRRELGARFEWAVLRVGFGGVVRSVSVRSSFVHFSTLPFTSRDGSFL